MVPLDNLVSECVLCALYFKMREQDRIFVSRDCIFSLLFREVLPDRLQTDLTTGLTYIKSEALSC